MEAEDFTDDEVLDDLDDEFLAEIEAARARTELQDRIEPRAVRAWYDADRHLVMFEIRNGCVFGFPPPENPYWGLKGATPAQLAEVEPIENGYGLHWEELDADLSIQGLMFDLLNIKAWYARWLGGAKSEAKAAAARENGKKGGRPRKQPVEPKRAARRKSARAGG
jgi:hypothetical protein